MSRRVPSALSLAPLSLVVALVVATVAPSARGQEPRPRQVIAVAALDSYADVKKQLTNATTSESGASDRAEGTRRLMRQGS